jgi:hypothetical protein
VDTPAEAIALASGWCRKTGNGRTRAGRAAFGNCRGAIYAASLDLPGHGAEERSVAHFSTGFALGRSPTPWWRAVGRNQRLIVLARCSPRNRVCSTSRPTRGVDVGAKAEIHDYREPRNGGRRILPIWSEPPEVLTLSQRILVLRAGRIVGEVTQAQVLMVTVSSAHDGGPWVNTQAFSWLGTGAVVSQCI